MPPKPASLFVLYFFFAPLVTRLETFAVTCLALSASFNTLPLPLPLPLLLLLLLLVAALVLRLRLDEPLVPAAVVVVVVVPGPPEDASVSVLAAAAVLARYSAAVFTFSSMALFGRVIEGPCGTGGGFTTGGRFAAGVVGLATGFDADRGFDPTPH